MKSPSCLQGSLVLGCCLSLSFKYNICSHVLSIRSQAAIRKDQRKASESALLTTTTEEKKVGRKEKAALSTPHLKSGHTTKAFETAQDK